VRENGGIQRRGIFTYRIRNGKRRGRQTGNRPPCRGILLEYKRPVRHGNHAGPALVGRVPRHDDGYVPGTQPEPRPSQRRPRRSRRGGFHRLNAAQSQGKPERKTRGKQKQQDNGHTRRHFAPHRIAQGKENGAVKRRRKGHLEGSDEQTHGIKRPAGNGADHFNPRKEVPDARGDKERKDKRDTEKEYQLGRFFHLLNIDGKEGEFKVMKRVVDKR